MEKERLTIEIGREELLRRYRIALPWWIFATVLLAGATAVEVGAANLVNPFACRDIIADLPRVMDECKIENLREIWYN